MVAGIENNSKMIKINNQTYKSIFLSNSYLCIAMERPSQSQRSKCLAVLIGRINNTHDCLEKKDAFYSLL